MNQFYSLKDEQAQSHEYNKWTLDLFIDLKQAFDRNKRKEI